VTSHRPLLHFSSLSQRPRRRRVSTSGRKDPHPHPSAPRTDVRPRAVAPAAAYSPVSVADAQAMRRAADSYLAAADPTDLTVAELAGTLIEMEQGDAIRTVERAWLLGAFLSAEGPAADGDASARIWLVHKTGVTLGVSVNTVLLDEYVTGAVLDALESPQVQEAVRAGADTGAPRRPELLEEIHRAQEKRADARRDWAYEVIDKEDWLDIRQRTDERIARARKEYDRLSGTATVLGDIPRRTWCVTRGRPGTPTGRGGGKGSSERGHRAP
jgi:hypothetical protein